ncbi:hypothetical protein DFH08DRAFT_822238 [Mycena albidolilacea]|uniref:CCHC-type domain-containing protein n=1 Tax=Mycena albidolilacea TaxID=1033008 RepID=A0AAD6Z9K7_9AGAR|nr:hypothetical protein DFH08DRAFT_822238 [Mycena albidolilacea]
MSHSLPPLGSSHASVPALTTSALIELFTKLLRALIAYLSPTSSHASQPPRRPFVCSYCSDPAHLIRHCPHVASDICVGICKRNAHGKVVLPSGLFVPHYIPGSNLRARITEYQRQSTTAALPILSPASAVVAAPTGPEHKHSTLRPTTEPIPISSPHTSPPPSLPALDVDEHRITEIQRELASLRTHDDAAPMSQPLQLPNTAPTSPIASRSPPHDLSSQTYHLPAASQRPTDIPGYAPPTARNFGLPPTPTHNLSVLPHTSNSTPPTTDLSFGYDIEPDVPYTFTLHEVLSFPPDIRSQILAAAATVDVFGASPRGEFV